MDTPTTNTPPAGSVTSEKVPPLILRIVTDPGFVASAMTGIGVGLGVHYAAADLPPHERVELYKSALYAMFGIVSTATAAAGYKVGKLYEGATPVGFVSNIATPAVTAIQVGEPIEMTTATLQSNSGNAGAGGTSFGAPIRPGFVVAKLLAILSALAMLALLSGGCVSTSETFKRTIAPGVSNVVDDMHAYTSSKNWDANGDGKVDDAELSTRRAEEAKTETLAQSVATPKKTTLTGVASAWRPVEPIWSGYVNVDRTLTTPEDKKIRLDTGRDINALIDAEATRQNAIRTHYLLPPVDVGK